MQIMLSSKEALMFTIQLMQISSKFKKNFANVYIFLIFTCVLSNAYFITYFVAACDNVKGMANKQ
jgi:hypothetical protein